jgi:catechol 2,3-dioxygenase
MLQRIEHALLQVEDRTAAVDWYRDVMGLVEVESTDEVTYLGTGLDHRFDMAVREGTPGLDHFALKADDTATVDDVEGRLEDEGVEYERVDGEEPGQEAGVSFRLPTGAKMEVVTVEDYPGGVNYAHADDNVVGRRGGATPADLDHITFLTADIEADVTFLSEVVGMKISEIAGPDGGWEMAFLRGNYVHHDIALRQNPDESVETTGLHHLAWEFDGIEHMKLFLDHVCRNGVEVERGLGRHYAGNNLYSYFWEPGGNRFEICSEMATIETDTVGRSPNYEEATVAWGPGAPESFSDTSQLL